MESSVLEKSKLLNILDDAGNPVSFGSLFENQKIIVVFIRHFFCGSCQAYVKQLATVRRDALAEANVDLIVVGCGDWQPIKAYMETTGFEGEIYADPTRNLYHAFGMTIETLAGTPKDQEKKSYMPNSFMKNVFSSIIDGPLKHPQHIGKQGNLSQLGGDFVLGPDTECVFSHIMQNTEDHVEVAELLQKAGVAYP